MTTVLPFTRPAPHEEYTALSNPPSERPYRYGLAREWVGISIRRVMPGAGELCPRCATCHWFTIHVTGAALYLCGTCHAPPPMPAPISPQHIPPPASWEEIAARIAAEPFDAWAERRRAEELAELREASENPTARPPHIMVEASAEPDAEPADDTGEAEGEHTRAYGRMLIGDRAAVCLDRAGAPPKVRTFSASTPAPVTLGDVLHLADAAGASLVWIDPYSELRGRLRAGDVATFCMDVPELPRLPRDAKTGDIFAWQSIQREGKPRVAVAFPLPGDQKGYLWTAPALDGEEASEAPPAQVDRFTHDLRGVFYAGAALDYRIRATPSYTARSLVAHKNGRRGWYQPARGDYRTLAPDVRSGSAAPLAWRGALSDSERELLASGCGWVHALDKRSAYLAAMGSLQLPLGEPFYRDGGTFGKVERQRPGLWRVRLTWPEDTPWNGRELPRIGASDEADGACWIWTPELAFAYDQGAAVEVLGAIRWPEDHRILGTWAAQCWAARVALSQAGADYPDEVAREWAYDAIKATYTTVYGLFGWRGPDTADTTDEDQDREPAKWWHREWAHLIRSEAAKRMYAHLDALHRAGLHAVSCHIDSFTLVTDSEAPPELPSAIRTDPARCGSFRHEWQAPGVDILPSLLSPQNSVYHHHAIPALTVRG